MKTIHKDYWGRYTSSSLRAEAKVYAKSVELRYMDSGMTTRYTVTELIQISVSSQVGGRVGSRPTFQTNQG